MSTELERRRILCNLKQIIDDNNESATREQNEYFVNEVDSRLRRNRRKNELGIQKEGISNLPDLASLATSSSFESNVTVSTAKSYDSTTSTVSIEYEIDNDKTRQFKRLQRLRNARRDLEAKESDSCEKPTSISERQKFMRTLGI